MLETSRMDHKLAVSPANRTKMTNESGFVVEFFVLFMMMFWKEITNSENDYGFYYKWNVLLC